MLDEAQLVLVPLYTKHKTKFVLQQFIIEYIQIYSRGKYTYRRYDIALVFKQTRFFWKN